MRDYVGVDAVRLALLREEGHRERLAPYTPTAALERVRAMWARELERQAERRAKVVSLGEGRASTTSARPPFKIQRR